MKNLEKEIINRLNKLLSTYGLKITTSTYKKYYLEDEITNSFIHIWDSIDKMLFDSLFSLFCILKKYYTDILYFSYIQPNIKQNKTFEYYKRYAAIYDNIKYLENNSCLEELIIKMDLMGV